MHSRSSEILTGEITESQISDLKDYITVETDPLFSEWDKSTGITIKENQVTDLKEYLTEESDPVFDSSPAGGIEANHITGWNAAHGWDDHSAQGYLKSFNETDPTWSGDANQSGNIGRGGNVGIGTTNPATLIHVHGAPVTNRGQLSLSAPSGQGSFLSFYEADIFKAYLWYDVSDDDLRLQNFTAGDLNLNPYGGRVGIGTNTPGYTLDVSGNINFTGSFTQNGSPFSMSWTNLTGKPTTFPPDEHSHSATDITSGTLNIAMIPTGTTSSTVALGDHAHGYISSSGSIGTTSGMLVATSINGRLTTKGGSAAGVMLYWDGSSWVNVPPGSTGQVLTIVHGAPKWEKPAIPTVGEIDVYNHSTGKVWMNRNLGASWVATSSTDANAYGWLYQWERGNDGHQSRISWTTTTLSSSDTPGHGDFITISSSPYDWRSPQNRNLWQGVNGVNNPCPRGYRLPTEAEWTAERQSWGSNNAAGSFASPLKLPMAGWRDYSSGSLSDVGTSSNYWSSSLGGSYSHYLGFFSTAAGMSIARRAYGFSVRCLKD